MSLTSYRAAPPRAMEVSSSSERFEKRLTRFGGDLLSHVLRRSTIGATALNCRVRDGIGCFARAMTTKPSKTLFHQLFFASAQGRNNTAASPKGRNDVVQVKHCVCMLLIYRNKILLLLDQIKPIEQLVPVN